MVIVAWAASGCAPRLPNYPKMNALDSVRFMAQRSDHVVTVSSPCRIIVQRPDGRSMQFEGALAAKPPGHLRLRAWKMSRPVLDLTLRPEGLWLFSAERNAHDAEAALDRLTADRVAEAWTLVLADFESAEWSAAIGVDRSVLRLVRSAEGAGAKIECQVERSTLTLRGCAIRESQGGMKLTLQLDRYRCFDGITWPTRIRCSSADGTVTVLLDDPVFNDAPPPRAFDPPARAVRLP